MASGSQLGRMLTASFWGWAAELAMLLFALAPSANRTFDDGPLVERTSPRGATSRSMPNLLTIFLPCDDGKAMTRTQSWALLRKSTSRKF